MVAEQPGINQADLTARIVRDQSTVTRQVDRLVKQGWLTKRQAPTDARRSALFLTPQAQAILPQLWAINQTVNKTALASLTPAEQATLLNLLGKKKGDHVDVEVPAGTLHFEILDISI